MPAGSLGHAWSPGGPLMVFSIWQIRCRPKPAIRRAGRPTGVGRRSEPARQPQPDRTARRARGVKTVSQTFAPRATGSTCRNTGAQSAAAGGWRCHRRRDGLAGRAMAAPACRRCRDGASGSGGVWQASASGGRWLGSQFRSPAWAVFASLFVGYGEGAGHPAGRESHVPRILPHVGKRGCRPGPVPVAPVSDLPSYLNLDRPGGASVWVRPPGFVGLPSLEPSRWWPDPGGRCGRGAGASPGRGWGAGCGLLILSTAVGDRWWQALPDGGR